MFEDYNPQTHLTPLFCLKIYQKNEYVSETTLGKVIFYSAACCCTYQGHKTAHIYQIYLYVVLKVGKWKRHLIKY